ncbi:MAG: 3-hydroxyacyl-CoA dehydrogenase NAD-binding domain-containing protein [Ahrensia sp.]
MKVAIIGGGVIGGGWAARFLLNGHDVSVYDPAPDSADAVHHVLDNARVALDALYEGALPRAGALAFCKSLEEACAGAAWVQESVPERLDLKHSVLGAIVDVAPATAIIGSSTSGFTPTALHEKLKDPSRVIVAHPFNPVYLLPLVELVGGDATADQTLEKAKTMLTTIGMKPLVLRKEIDAHIADRLLEAVWRESLWLVKDGVATTEEIDDAIRYGFGLRWAQMGLFETYRIAGGEAGMAHFLAQFGPALQWPWTKLMDVPELDDALIARISEQSDAQAKGRSIAALEAQRDGNLVAILKALAARDEAAGALLNAHRQSLSS